MRWQEKQAKIEADVYEAINELEDEIGVVAPYYPTVFWVGKTIEFEDTGLAERKQARFFKKVLARESYKGGSGSLYSFISFRPETKRTLDTRNNLCQSHS